MNEEQKQERVNKVVLKMREGFSKMSSEQRVLAKERMNSPEGK